MNRYNRHIILSEVGQEGQQKLLDAKVLVIGAGGLGCPVLQYLVAAGIGIIGIVDHDTVEESNLQRQILFGTSSIGQNKALAAKSRLEDLNPTIKIQAYSEMLSPENALKLFSQYDIIVDGTDNFETRYLINDAAIITNKPVVYGAIYKFEGQVSVFNFKNGPSYRCLFPNLPKQEEVPNCSEVGVLGVLPGVIGAMQANEILKIILEFDSVLSGKLLCYDSKAATSYTMKISKNQSKIKKVLESKNNFEARNFSISCSNNIEVSVNELSNYSNIQFIDIREIHEQPKLSLNGLINIPLQELESRIKEIPKNRNIIVFCQSGIRSKTAVEMLRNHNITNSYSLKEGASALEKQYIES